MNIKMKKALPALSLISALFWGLSYPLVKMNQTAFGASDIPSLMLIAGIRFIISGGIIAVWNLFRHRKNPAIPAYPGRGGIGHVLILALTMTAVHYLFMYMGLGICTGSKSSIIKQTSVLIVIFLSGLFFPEDGLNLPKVAGCLLGFAGVVVCSMPLSDFDFVPAGDIPIFLAAVSVAAGDLYSKRATRSIDPIFLSGWQQLAGGIILTAAGLIAGAAGGKLPKLTVTPRAVGVLLAVCGASIVAYTLYMVLTKYCDLSKLSMFKLTIPVFSVLTSGFLLGEDMTKPQYWASILLVSAGVVIANLSIRHPAATPEPASADKG